MLKVGEREGLVKEGEVGEREEGEENPEVVGALEAEDASWGSYFDFFWS